MSKVCAKCKQEKPSTEFQKKPGCKDGLHSYCRPCVKEANASHYQANKEKRRADGRAWHAKNKEAVAVRKKVYTTNHKEHISADNKRRMTQNRAEWMQIITERGLTTCSVCGYDKSFEAIDFHHVNPDEKVYAVQSCRSRASRIRVGRG